MLVQVTINYTAADFINQFADATITVTVIAPLVAGADAATVTLGNSVTINVLANDIGGTPPLRLVGGVSQPPTPDSGSVMSTASGEVTYTAPVGFGSFGWDGRVS